MMSQKCKALQSIESFLGCERNVLISEQLMHICCWILCFRNCIVNESTLWGQGTSICWMRSTLGNWFMSLPKPPACQPETNRQQFWKNWIAEELSVTSLLLLLFEEIWHFWNFGVGLDHLDWGGSFFQARQSSWSSNWSPTEWWGESYENGLMYVTLPLKSFECSWSNWIYLVQLPSPCGTYSCMKIA